MNNQELQRLVEEVSVSSFNRPFVHQAMFNQRLKTTGGRYHLKDHHLDFNPRLVEKYDQQELIKVIKHELCHYHLHLTGRGYQHKDQEFKQLLKCVGGSRYAPPLIEEKKSWCYQCHSCGQLYSRKRKMDVQRYVCGKCKGKLQLI